MSSSFGFDTASNKLDVQKKQGLFNPSQGRQATNRGIDLGIGGLFPGLAEGNNRVGDELAENLFNPQFGADTASEKSLINSIRDFTQGNSATRGIQTTPDSIASAIAPTLVKLRQQDIGNLQSQQGLNTQDIATAIAALLFKGKAGENKFFSGQQGSSFGFNKADSFSF